MEEEQSIEHHLKQALSHLEAAINLSVVRGAQDPQQQKIIGHQWEVFLAQFFGYARDRGKEYRVNLLGWISFPRLRH
ncbi:MAG: hypothetical protein ACYCVD_12885 [Desulfitobacteriaceae bacterium]